MTHESTPIAIERALTLDILRGRYAAGSRLPTVRELAVLHAVNPATIQRVVARLETRGLVEARQGSGLRVIDPASSGDVSLVPYWLVATLDEPAKAVSILADLLEVRRVMAVRLVVRHRAAILARGPELAVAAARVTEAAREGVGALRDADLDFARALLRATSNVVAIGVLNTVAHVLEELPEVTEAMYGDPRRNAASVARVAAALIANDADAAATIEAEMAAVDEETLRRFESALARRRRRRA